MTTKRARFRPWKALVWSVAIAVIVLAGLWIIPTGQVVVAPGVTGNLADMVRVEGGKVPRRGRMMMVAVTVGTANALIDLYARLNPTMELLPVKAAFGNLNMRQYEAYNRLEMQISQETAEVVGERLAGLPAGYRIAKGALVWMVSPGPAQGRLEAGDRIVRIGPYPVPSYLKVRAIMEHFKVGDVVTFTVIRHGKTVQVPIRTTRIAGDPAPAVGVYLAPAVRYIIPRKVTIKSQGIGGPSAGMMFALEIYQQITGRNLARGRAIAGTGEIYPNGRVGVIGGIGQKVVTVERAGARIFLCPVGNYAKALAMKRRMGYHALKIYPVSTIAQALSDLARGSGATTRHKLPG